MKNILGIAIALLMLGLAGCSTMMEEEHANPCAMKQMDNHNPCNPCAMKHMKDHNPCSMKKMNPCNPCAMKHDSK